MIVDRFSVSHTLESGREATIKPEVTARPDIAESARNGAGPSGNDSWRLLELADGSLQRIVNAGGGFAVFLSPDEYAAIARKLKLV